MIATVMVASVLLQGSPPRSSAQYAEPTPSGHASLLPDLTRVNLRESLQHLRGLEDVAPEQMLHASMKSAVPTSLSFVDGVHWLRASVHNPTPQAQARILHMAWSAQLADVQLTLWHGDTQTGHWQTGEKTPVSRRPLHADGVAIPLVLQPGPSVLLLRIEPAGAVLMLDPQLSTPRRFFKDAQQRQAINWGSYGVLFIMGIYHMVVYLALRDRGYLHYMGFLLGSLLYQMNFDGSLQTALGLDDPHSLARLYIPSAMMMTGFQSYYSHHVLTCEVLCPRTGKVLQWTGGLFMASALLMALFMDRGPASQIFVAVSGPAMGLCCVAGWFSYRAGFPPARIYMLSWLVLSLSILAVLLTTTGLIAPNLFTDNVMRASATLQVVLYAFVLSSRVGVLRARAETTHGQLVASQRERLQAQEHALRLERDASENLQRKVLERTHELQESTSEAVEARRFAEAAKLEADMARFEAEAAHDRLAEFDRQKTGFFQNISHELRTPLTLILNPLKSALARHQGDGDLRVAERNARRLQRLVNQLLDFQKLRARKERLNPSHIDLVEMAMHAGHYFAPSASANQIEFSVSHNNEPLPELSEHDGADDAVEELPKLFVVADVDALEKIVFNYLSNALKYTSEGGTINLDVGTRHGEARLTVIDNGLGIKPEDQSRLFKLFSQLDDSDTREREGTGLGLALVKELAQAMNAEVGVESQPGQGSQFWCQMRINEPTRVGTDLPASRTRRSVRDWLLADAPEADRTLEDVPATLAAAAGSTLEHSTARARREADKEGKPDTTLPANAIQVLVVDDLPDMRNLVSRSLRAIGYATLTASNGAEALELLRGQRPDLMVTDWMMPGMSGTQLVEAVRADSDLSSIPIVMLTARSDEESKNQGTDCGADAFLGKPFDDSELHATVRNLVNLKAREREVTELNQRIRETILSRYVHQDLVEQLLAGDPDEVLAPTPTTATVLFSDLVGFTRLSRQLRASRMASVLNEYLTAMTEVIFAHGGTIDKFIGDAVMVLFGAPTQMSPETQARRAMDCAAEMHTRMKALNAAWVARDLPSLAMRIGMHQGPVVVGNFGSDQRSEYTAIGDTVNMASRIESSCASGQVYISKTLADLLPEEEAEEVGYVELKGIDEPQMLYRMSTARLRSRDAA